MKNKFVNPGALLNFVKPISPWLGFASVMLLASGLWLSFYNSPIDYQQGNAVRIMYVHVPAAWMSMMIYGD